MDIIQYLKRKLIQSISHNPYIIPKNQVFDHLKPSYLY